MSYYGNNNNYGGTPGGYSVGGGGGYSPYGAAGNNTGQPSYGGGGAYGGSGAYGGGASSSYPDYNDTSNYNVKTTTDADDEHNKYSKIKKQNMQESLIMHSIWAGITVVVALWITFGMWWNMSSQYKQVLQLEGVVSRRKTLTLEDITDKFIKLKNRNQDLEDELYQLDNTRGNDKASAKDIVTSSRGISKEQQTKLKDLEQFQQRLTEERDALKAKHEGPEKKAEETKMSERQRTYQERVLKLQVATRRESKRTILERFGNGPYKVQLTLPVPNNNNDDNNQNSNNETCSILIEMAPLSTVPHAIHLFLEQIDHGLWNDSKVSVYLNSMHVLQIGPKLLKEEEDVEDPEQYVRSSQIPFQEADLDTLAFPDYSPDYPHLEWTIGFAGRPGGPDIYINKIDNTELHGPGGQFQHALADEQGDACFGKIVEGKDDIQKYLYSQQVYKDVEGWEDYIIHPIPILKAEIVTDRPRDGDDVVVDMDAGTSTWTTPKTGHRFHEDVVSTALERYHDDIDLETTTLAASALLVAAGAFPGDYEHPPLDDSSNGGEEQTSTTGNGDSENSAGEGTTTANNDDNNNNNAGYVYGDHPPTGNNNYNGGVYGSSSANTEGGAGGGGNRGPTKANDHDDLKFATSGLGIY